jgi:SAM-dependent methyltransferase/uncharacterized membrane protein YbhN (UPF0104 family)
LEHGELAKTVGLPGASARTLALNVVATLIVVTAVASVASMFPDKLRTIQDRLASIELAGVALAVAAASVQLACQSTRFWCIASRIGIDHAAVLRTFVTGQAINSAAPARAGDAAKVFGLYREGVPAGAAAGVLVADKAVDLGVVVLLAAVFVPRALAVAVARFSAASALMITALVGAVAIIAWFHRQRIRRLVQPLAAGVAALRSPARIGAAVGVEVCAWMTEVFALCFISAAAGQPLSFVPALTALLVLNVGVAVPIGVGNFGPYEASLALGLSAAGVPLETAVAVAVVHHLVQLGVVGAGLLLVSIRGHPRPQFRVDARVKQRAIAHYSRHGCGYQTAVDGGPLRVLRMLERRAVLQLARIRAGEHVADVGCGDGWFALEAKRRGAHVVAIDASPEMVAAVAARVDEVRTGDLEQLDLDGQYDCVLAIGVLDFVSEPREAMATLARLVGPGGRLVVLVPRTGLGGLYYRLEKRLSGFDTNLYTVRWLRERGRELGLDLVAARAPLPTNLAVRFDRARVPPPSARG